MAEQKKQHFVPQFYIKSFANEKGGISIFNINNDKIHNQVPYKSQCSKDYFYGKDKIWENRLSKKESKWAVIFSKIHAQKKLENQDITLMKEFALFQRLRTDSENEYHKEERKEAYIEMAKSSCAIKGDEYKEEYDEYFRKKAYNSITPIQLLEEAAGLVDLIKDLKLLVINYETETQLISSDAPVLFINPFHKFSLGMDVMGIVILFPISCKQLIVIYDGKMYTRYKKYEYISNNDEQEVLNLNIMQFISAEKIVFANRENELVSLVNNSLAQEERDKNREPKKIDALGSRENRLIRFSVKKTIHDCDLSFALLSHKERKIPFTCREAVSRRYDEKVEEKLRVKETLVPAIIKQQEITEKLGLSKKELKRGFQKMTKYAEVYWNSKE